jgi:succinate dehydrogenase / fumarate reductase cytochrome b subunit
MQQTLTLTQTSIGKKAVMALSGLTLFGFAIGHCLGNLQVFLGPEALNRYAAGLKALPAIVWGARLFLLVVFLTHVITAMKLVSRSQKARPHAYQIKRDVATSYASRTMRWTGPLLLLFIGYHLAHFTVPGLSFGSYAHSTHDVYANVVNGFSVPWVSSLYIAAQLALGVHLYHGAWSILQSLGLSHPKYDARAKAAAQTLAVALVVANITIPLGVVFQVIR